jgi:hypothetical protein
VLIHQNVIKFLTPRISFLCGVELGSGFIQANMAHTQHHCYEKIIWHTLNTIVMCACHQCIGTELPKQHINISMCCSPSPGRGVLVLASVSLLSRVHFRRCCQELVHIAQTRRNKNSAAATMCDSWLLSCYHALPLLFSTPASHPLMIPSNETFVT